MRKSKAAVAVLLLFGVVGSPLAAQQSNSASSSLIVNQNQPAGPGPYAVNVAGGGALVLDLGGTPLAPFALLWGVTQAGAIPTGTPAGILDLAYPSPPPQFIFNGLAPTTIFDLFANLDGAGAWGIQASLSAGSTVGQFGLQALVTDFTAGFPFFVLSAATDVSLGNFTTATVTFNEPGDDTTVTYFHQVTSFNFYGTNYGRTNIDSNGYLTFGDPIDSQWATNVNDFLMGPPRIAPYWSDMHMSSVVASTFGNLSLGPASFVITETAGTMGSGTISFEWRNSTEAAGTASIWDYRCVIDSLNNSVALDYGLSLGMGFGFPGSGNIFAILGVSPGGGLSANTMMQDIVSPCMAGGSGVNGCMPFVTGPNDAVFEVFDPSTGAFPLDFQASTITFSQTPGFPTVYTMQ